MQNYLRILILIIVTGCLSACHSNDNHGPDLENGGIDSLEKGYSATETAKINDLTKEITKDPNNPDLFYQRALAHKEAGNVQSAINDLNIAIKLNPSQSEYFNALGDIYYEAKNIDKALKYYQNSCLINPENVKTNLQLAWISIIMKQYENAISYCNDVLKIDVFNTLAYFYKGLTFKELGDTSKAISSFITATEQDPDYYHAYMQAGLLLSARNDKSAIDFFRNAIRIDSNSIESHYGLAMYYQNTGNQTEAVNIYKKIIIKEPQFEQGYYNIGYIYYNKRSIDTAYKYFNTAIKVSPAFAKAYYMRGLCAETMGKKEDAKADFQQALIFNDELKLAAEGLKRLEN